MSKSAGEIARKIVNAAPDISTLDLGVSEYSLGSMVELDVAENVSGADAFVDGTPALDDLAGDIFWSLYDDPGGAKEVPNTRRVNQTLVDWMKDSKGYGEAVEDTQYDLPVSMASAGLMFNHMTQEKVVQEALKKQEEAEAERQRQLVNQQLAAGMRKAGADDAADKYEAWATEAAAKADQIADAAAAILDGVKDNPAMQAAVNLAGMKAAEKAQEVRQVMMGYGLGPGSNVQGSAEEALKFLAAMSEDIARIAEIAGRIKGFAMTAIREAVKFGPMTTHVGLTKDLMKVLPVERTYLSPKAPPVLRAMKVASLVTEGLPGWSPSGEGEKAGPFVGAVDFSPSMWGDRLIVAKGIALGLARAAQEQDREYILFCFASDESAISCVSSQDGWQAHLAWASAQTSGGTDFDMALTYACQKLAELSDYERADLMFISDGEGHVSEENIEAWQRWRKEAGARLQYIPVGSAHETDEHYNIDQVADEIIPLAQVDEASGTKLAVEMAPYLAR